MVNTDPNIVQTKPKTAVQSGCLGSLVFIVIALMLYGVLLDGMSGIDGKIASLIGIVVILISNKVFRTIQAAKAQKTAPSAEDVMASDYRDPIFFLRSFQADSDKTDMYNIQQNMLTYINPYAFIGRSLFTKPSFEQSLAMQMQQIGPFIALSKPDEAAELGAAKLAEVAHKDWQDVVSDYLSKSQLVMMRAGETEGLFWEITKIFNEKMMDKLILFLQFPGPQDAAIVEAKYCIFAERFTEITGAIMPMKLGVNRFMTFTTKAEGRLWPSLAPSMIEMGLPVEENDARATLKGYFPSADQSWVKPFSWAQKIPNGLRWPTLMTFGFALVTAVMFGFASFILSFDNYPGMLELIVAVCVGFFASMAIGRFSAKIMAHGGKGFFWLGISLGVWSLYFFLVNSFNYGLGLNFGEWDWDILFIMEALSILLTTSEYVAFIGALVIEGMLFSLMSLFLYGYGLSRAEKIRMMDKCNISE